MTRAIWNDIVLAESDAAVEMDGHHYFPPEGVRWDLLVQSDRRTGCPFKGNAVYYHLSANGTSEENAAWSYDDPSTGAWHLKGYVAFGNTVQIEQ